MTDASVLGRVLWNELLTTDVDAAEKFYTSVVGWTVTPFRPSPDRYDMWTRGGNITVGGVMKIPAGMNFPPHWEIYVGVPKLDDAVAKIERLGGSALSPVIEVPDVGRMRTMKDPQGAAFCVYEPSSPPQRPEQEAETGDLSWLELMTTDLDGALKFYTELFGWRLDDAMDMGEMGKYQMFSRTFMLGGMMKKPPELARVPPNWGLYFRVPDVHAAGTRVKEQGGQVLNGPMEVPGGDWVVNCMDPQGGAFSLHHKKQG